VLFGFIMLVSTVRFALKGWIYELYIRPEYFFSYYGFEWVQPFGALGIYGVFAVIGLSSLAIMLGWRYRWAAVAFFLSFTYVELIDKTHYLNHYYFISLIAFLLIWVPANRSFSLDVLRRPGLQRDKVPAWTVNIFKFQLAVVYFFAGVAKLNPDWLLRAMPMEIWLPAHSNWPVIGSLLTEDITAYLFSWAGAAFDLSIAFLLMYRPTRLPAYAAVIVFHLFTYALFQIGMFPFIMILLTLVFFSSEFHQKILDHARRFGRSIRQIFSEDFEGLRTRTAVTPSKPSTKSNYSMSGWSARIVGGMIGAFVVLQLLMPLRSWLYPGNVLWTEQGFRFSWRVMLVEKAGHAVFHVYDSDSGRQWEAANWRHLTPRQEKMMSMKPDMMLQYAHYLEEVYKEQGKGDVRITADTRVTMNRRKGRPIVDPTVDLTEAERGWHDKKWILPLRSYRSALKSSSLPPPKGEFKATEVKKHPSSEGKRGRTLKAKSEKLSHQVYVPDRLRDKFIPLSEKTRDRILSSKQVKSSIRNSD